MRDGFRSFRYMASDEIQQRAFAKTALKLKAPNKSTVFQLNLGDTKHCFESFEVILNQVGHALEHNGLNNKAQR